MSSFPGFVVGFAFLRRRNNAPVTSPHGKFLTLKQFFHFGVLLSSDWSCSFFGLMNSFNLNYILFFLLFNKLPVYQVDVILVFLAETFKKIFIQVNIGGTGAIGITIPT